MIPASVPDDVVKPRIERRFTAEFRQPGKNFEEYVLGDLRGVGRIPGHEHRQPIDTTLIPLEQKPLRLGILLPTPLHQIIVVRGILRAFPDSQNS
jgi:hypothetical protein